MRFKDTSSEFGTCWNYDKQVEGSLYYKYEQIMYEGHKPSPTG